MMWNVASNPVRNKAENDEFGRPVGDCLVCGTPFFVERKYQQMGLCGECARIAGASWLRSHAGEIHQKLDPEGYEADLRKRRKAPPKKLTVPAKLRWKVFARDDFTCKSCGSRSCLTADHIVPECRGGETTFANLQTLCATCNSSKGAREQ